MPRDHRGGRLADAGGTRPSRRRRDPSLKAQDPPPQGAGGPRPLKTRADPTSLKARPPHFAEAQPSRPGEA
ncbi:hypothetical protein GCM10023336_21010 [Streptomyces similanensis]|uniref:Uncharacterized protein n=1 Tax=Streptomyces similanensis TaxID=1274988 RepID=A0ABP9K8K2_9ACTN